MRDSIPYAFIVGDLGIRLITAQKELPRWKREAAEKGPHPMEKVMARLTQVATTVGSRLIQTRKQIRVRIRKDLGKKINHHMAHG